MTGWLWHMISLLLLLLLFNQIRSLQIKLILGSLVVQGESIGTQDSYTYTMILSLEICIVFSSKKRMVEGWTVLLSLTQWRQNAIYFTAYLNSLPLHSHGTVAWLLMWKTLEYWSKVSQRPVVTWKPETSWTHPQMLINDCFSWMICNHYMKIPCLAKHWKAGFGFQRSTGSPPAAHHLKEPVLQKR